MFHNSSTRIFECIDDYIFVNGWVVICDNGGLNTLTLLFIQYKNKNDWTSSKKTLCVSIFDELASPFGIMNGVERGTDESGQRMSYSSTISYLHK